jgi:hypothetical protein
VRRVHVDEVLEESSGDAGVDLHESATTGSHRSPFPPITGES